MRSVFAAVFAALSLSVLPSAAAARAGGPGDLAGHVWPLSGTTGAGFPAVGAFTPFSMIQPGPDTAEANGSVSPVNFTGYAYQDPSIRDFSLTHFNGGGIQIDGDLPFTPTTGPVAPADPLAQTSPYDHGTEVAQPGYYAVTLDRWQTRVELTSTTRAAMMRLSYPAAQPANLSLSVSSTFGHSGRMGALEIVGNDELRGYTHPDVGAPLYFDAKFDRPFASWGTTAGQTVDAGSRSVSGVSAGGYVTFDTSSSPTVTMRVAVSYVDQAGAANNLATELPPSATFDTVRAAARRTWDDALARATVTGGDPGMQDTYYTNLYRAQLMPSTYDDADGRYTGFDGAVRTLPGGTHHYSNLSSWDTYRSQTPLLELIQPQVMHDLATSLLDDAEQAKGAIPNWTQSNVDRGVMGGDSGTASLAELVVNGTLAATDAQRAYAHLLAQATDLSPPAESRADMAADLRHGFVPLEDDPFAGSVTLEYAIDDSAVEQVAQRLGDQANGAALRSRAGYWRNLLDPSSHFLRPRNRDGTWANPTHRIQGHAVPSAPVPTPWSPDFQDGFQEGTGWQYLWSVPQDVGGLAKAIGSPARTLARLDRFFSEPLDQPLAPAAQPAQEYGSLFGIYYVGDQYTPANEPDLWTPFYYDWLGQPWKTQRVVRAEMANFSTRPDGLPGNDDAGEMSAWYVLSALGLYHAAPATAAWELASPAFSSATLELGGGRTLRIEAPGAGNALPYVRSASLGGRALARSYVTTCELEHAGRLSFAVGPVPSAWATGAGAAPPSLADSSVSAPVLACAGVSNGAGT